MRKVAILLVAVLIPLFPEFTTSANAVKPLQPILDCVTNPEDPCIEAIYLVSSDGVRKQAKLTGRTSRETRTYAPESVLYATWQEYAVDGYTFGGKAGNAFIPRGFYFPFGNRDCFYTPCVQGNQYIEFAVIATWLNGPPSTTPLPMPFRSSNRACGLKANPSFCYEQQVFNTDSVFEFHIRIPSDFVAVASTGRGVQDYSFNTVGTFVKEGANFIQVVTRVKPIPYSGYGLFGADVEEYAHFETDAFQFWLWGQEDFRVKQLAQCYQIPKLSVVSNIFHASFPQWDTTEQSIYVNLAGPHYKSDGTINYGLIQIKITKEMAQCLWSVDVSKKVQAKVSITYDTDGKQQTQTVAAGYTGSEYRLTISGMHFSSPTLKVRIVDNQTPVVQSTPSQETKTITCTKGKSKKIVKSANPSCPKGWVTSQPVKKS